MPSAVATMRLKNIKLQRHEEAGVRSKKRNGSKLCEGGWDL